MSTAITSTKTRDPLPGSLDLTIDHLTPTGEGVATWEGQPVLVRFVLPGEIVRVRPFWAKGKRGVRPHLRGDLIDVLRRSPERVDAPCRYFGRCGGCQYQHVDYPAQLAIKSDGLQAALAAYPGLDLPPPRPVLGCPEPWGYRNQLRLSIDREGLLSFTLAGRRRTFPVEHCLIAGPAINQALATRPERYPARHQVAIRCGFRTGDLILYPPHSEDAVADGGEYLTEEILGRRFRIHHSSFFQVNTRPLARRLPAELTSLGWPADGAYSQAEVLCLLVLAALAPRPSDRIIDAYAGVGVFAGLLADRSREVVAIEESATAVADARANLAGLTNVTICQEKTEAALDDQLPADAVILDPARPGCAPPVLDALLARPVERLVYVSCEPATLARDLDRLSAGYRVDWIQPLDMFPQTRHLETVVRLSARHSSV